ncbi:molybdopterin-guanine dinucleotide biosynthesis protein B [Candidatus Aerophobetes bacterium]|uniref:Molybdopterin-guanine dinucleotide biosynthesis protein B n=1 Tax=Aerophobetes bacterium TaxID=2030807 RepID=A0A523UL71_UNCAE|nr:MAG: molybdopterin-guanine dinucleotide biosynthesis protein B [Candidatus Aerophobetes bacterium]
MKVVGVIGYKGSGKTSLVVGLSRELKKRGYRVATVKHIHGEIDLPQANTAKHGQYTGEVAAISQRESAVFFKRKKSLEDIMGYLEADFVLVEGFKSERTYPKVVCLREKDEAKDLFDGLQILVAMLSPKKLRPGLPVLRILEDVERIADIIEKRAFKLPNLNCRACGYETCYELAKEIIKGNKTDKDCPPLNPSTEVRLGGKILPMNPFVDRIVKSTIKGVISSLKGFRKGRIEIKIEE